MKTHQKTRRCSRGKTSRGGGWFSRTKFDSSWKIHKKNPMEAMKELNGTLIIGNVIKKNGEIYVEQTRTLIPIVTYKDELTKEYSSCKIYDNINDENTKLQNDLQQAVDALEIQTPEQRQALIQKIEDDAKIHASHAGNKKIRKTKKHIQGGWFSRRQPVWKSIKPTDEGFRRQIRKVKPWVGTSYLIVRTEVPSLSDKALYESRKVFPTDHDYYYTLYEELMCADNFKEDIKTNLELKKKLYILDNKAKSLL